VDGRVTNVEMMFLYQCRMGVGRYGRVADSGGADSMLQF
jgi:hypothetical protein